ESIVSDDIGKFPDTTVAAALQRVPGIQVSMGDNNEVVSPLIRGIGDILTTVDGREMFTGVGRGFAFQDLPAEALAGVDVYKSSSADLTEGGVAGVINLKLHKPLNFEEGLTTAFNTRVFSGTNAEDASYNIGGLISNRWTLDDGSDIGILLDVTYSDTNFDRPISYNCDPRSGNNGPAGAVDVILPSCAGGLNQIGDYQRPQVNAAFQWQMPSGLELYADAMHTEYKSRWETDFIFADAFSANNISNVVASDDCDQYHVQGEGFGGDENDPIQDLCVGVSASFSNTFGLTSTQARDSSTKQNLFAMGARYDLDSWSFDIDVSYQESNNNNRVIIVDIAKFVDVDLDVDVDDHGTIDMVGNPLGDSAGFRVTNSLFNDINTADSSQFSLEGNGTYFLDSSFIEEIQFGFRYTDRDSDYRSFNGGQGGFWDELDTIEGLPNDFLIESPSSISYINGGAHWLTPNRDYLLDNTDDLRTALGLPTGDPDFDPVRNFDASEQSTSAYVQGKYTTQVGGMELDGLFGVRAVKNDRTLTGTGIVNDVQTPVTTDTSTTTILPNFSARLELTGNVQMRFSAARTMSQPSLGDLNPGLFYQVPANSNIRPYGSGGNPELEAQLSDAFDTTLEYYFGEASYLSTAIYYRAVKNRVIQQIEIETIDGQEYNMSRPRNAGSVDLQGVEVSGQVFFDDLSDSLPSLIQGFGIMANFTLADSELTTKDDPLEGLPLLGVSKYSYNVGILYEQSSLTGRLVYTYRDGYDEFAMAGALHPVGSGPAFNKVRANGRLDFSLGYDINEHLTVNVDGTNLTGSKYYSYFGGVPSMPHDVRDDERTYGVSFRAKF
ncbi:MAG: TonB-dependent receptor, partial [Colwellia sp.]